MTHLFLGFRARAMSMAFVSFGLAVVAPAGLKGFWPFMQSPPGLCIVGLALMALGVSVEETGTMRRIRVGIALRLLAAAFVAGAIGWAWVLGAPNQGLATFGFILGAIGSVGTAIAVHHDAQVISDTRHGQLVQLKECSSSALEIDVSGQLVVLPMEEIIGAAVVSHLDGRAVVVMVREQARQKGSLSLLPWVASTREAEAFVLSEHQANMDAEQLVATIVQSAKFAGHSQRR